MIKLKATKNQSFTYFFEDTFFEKQQEGQTEAQAVLGLIGYFTSTINVVSSNPLAGPSLRIKISLFLSSI